MNSFRTAALITGTITSSMFAHPTLARADTGQLSIELNKFESNENGGCQAFFLFRNQTDLTFEGFEMSFAVLNNEGVIDRLLTIDAAPLPAARTTLKLFEIPETTCDGISALLLHELASCRPQNAEEMDCFPLLDLVSRTNASLEK
ncbi:hypothetical protein AB9F26_00095 [Falsihalocynthiibacter sp. BN13B15]|uniref:hypothetical protein n=1 Tax=Falsihalocynthiibacter sp. BN13B15 TaxID=3240871 RepID=UPI00350FB27D